MAVKRLIENQLRDGISPWPRRRLATGWPVLPRPRPPVRAWRQTAPLEFQNRAAPVPRGPSGLTHTACSNRLAPDLTPTGAE